MFASSRFAAVQQQLLMIVVLLLGRTSGLLTSIPESAVETFRSEGFAIIRNALTPEETAELDPHFEYVMNGTLEAAMAKDFTDMSKNWDAPFETWSIVNGMLPSRSVPKSSLTFYTPLTVASCVRS